MSELHAVQETRGSKCVSIWEKQSGGLFRSECIIAPRVDVGIDPYKTTAGASPPPYAKSLPVTHTTGVCWRIKRSSAGAMNLA